MFASTPTGLSHASLSKGLMIVLGINSLFMKTFSTKSKYDLQLSRTHTQFWRLVTSNFGKYLPHKSFFYYIRSIFRLNSPLQLQSARTTVGNYEIFKLFGTQCGYINCLEYFIVGSSEIYRD